MKLTTGILAITIIAGAAWAQNPQQKQANDTKPASQAAGVAAPAAKPAPGSPAPAVKPATIPAAKPSTASGNNQLQRVNVIPGGDNIQIEISSSRAVTPRVSKLASPARVLVELPETVMANSQNHIPVGTAGVKGLRIGMDGKTPPTTSVVVDLEKAVSYELTPGPADKLVLTLHTEGAGKGNPAPVKAAAAPAETAAKNASPAAKPQSAAVKPAVAIKPAAEPKAVALKAPATKVAAPQAEAKPAAPKAAKENKAVVQAKGTPETAKKTPASPKPEEKKWAMNGKRDPFFSPVVQQQGGSGCSTGKKCLEIGAINLRGVVKSDNGFIAVVTNNLNKAYFLRENDPVFNGYVVKITGDSVVFQETLQDKLGKSFTREVVKRIFTPAV